MTLQDACKKPEDKMKRITSVLLVLSLLPLFGTVLSADQDTEVVYRDVSPSKWYYSEVMAAYYSGLMLGKPNNIFDPDGKVTRAEVAAILSRIDCADVSGMSSSSFSDVKEKDWFAGYISWATQAGVLKGYEDGTVRPNSPVTRSEMAVMLARYAATKEGTLPVQPLVRSFTDKAKIPSWASDAAEQMRQAGIFGGNDKGEFSPSSNASRAEVAALCVRFSASLETAKATVSVAVRRQTPDFVIAAGTGDSFAAGEMSDRIVSSLGCIMQRYEEDEPAEREIVMPGSGRDAEAEVMEGLGEYDYRIKVTQTDGNISVAIGYHKQYVRTSALDYLFSNYCNGDELRVPLDLDVTGSYEFSMPYGEPVIIDTNISQLRDPFVLVEDGIYYIYGTGWKMYKNTTGDLAGEWEGPYDVVETPSDFGNSKWAPEVYKYNGKYYMFTTYYSKVTQNRGCAVFASDSPEGPFKIISDGLVTPADWYSIDGSLYIDENGDPWMVFVHEHVSLEDHIGRMDVARMSEDLTKLISEPVEIFAANDPEWTNGKITDGPFIYKCQDGSLLMIWSNDDKFGYCVGVARQPEGKIDGEWVQEGQLYSLDFSGMDPGGHGMIFTALDGKMYLSFHAPNNAGFNGKTSDPYFLRIKEENNCLVWDN